jgi:hypothetical protein
VNNEDKTRVNWSMYLIYLYENRTLVSVNHFKCGVGR